MLFFENELMHAKEKSFIVCTKGGYMERYFLGNNSGNGFWNEYDGELKRADKVALIKGGSGTGKSTMMKKLPHLRRSRDTI